MHVQVRERLTESHFTSLSPLNTNLKFSYDLYSGYMFVTAPTCVTPFVQIMKAINKNHLADIEMMSTSFIGKTFQDVLNEEKYIVVVIEHNSSDFWTMGSNKRILVSKFKYFSFLSVILRYNVLV